MEARREPPPPDEEEDLLDATPNSCQFAKWDPFPVCIAQRRSVTTLPEFPGDPLATAEILCDAIVAADPPSPEESAFLELMYTLPRRDALPFTTMAQEWPIFPAFVEKLEMIFSDRRLPAKARFVAIEFIHILAVAIPDWRAPILEFAVDQISSLPEIETSGNVQRLILIISVAFDATDDVPAVVDLLQSMFVRFSRIKDQRDKMLFCWNNFLRTGVDAPLLNEAVLAGMLELVQGDHPGRVVFSVLARMIRKGEADAQVLWEAGLLDLAVQMIAENRLMEEAFSIVRAFAKLPVVPVQDVLTELLWDCLLAIFENGSVDQKLMGVTVYLILLGRAQIEEFRSIVTPEIACMIRDSIESFHPCDLEKLIPVLQQVAETAIRASDGWSEDVEENPMFDDASCAIDIEGDQAFLPTTWLRFNELAVRLVSEEE
jgi:hypothetical protein